LSSVHSPSHHIPVKILIIAIHFISSFPLGIQYAFYPLFDKLKNKQPVICKKPRPKDRGQIIEEVYTDFFDFPPIWQRF
jgi:hypothetical protein